MKGELVLIDNVFDESNEFEIGESIIGFQLIVFVDENNSLEKQLKDRKKYDYCMNTQKAFRDPEYDYKDTDKAIEYIDNNFDNILNSIEYIKLLFDEIDTLEFIRKNPILLSKKIVINEYLSITDFDRLNELMDKYNEISDKIYVNLDDNTNYVSLMDCYKTMNAIKEQAENIKTLQLSPMETIMYVYDQVRNRVYTFEDENDTVYKSRDLSEVMFGDKIVCAGYASIFHAFMHYLNIKSYQVHLIDNKQNVGHARNIVYVKDDKYDIDGVYYFDATWDSKRKNETNEYLNRYRYFAKTREYMENNSNHEYEETYFPVYSKDMVKIIEKIIKEKQYEKLIPYAKSLNYMSGLIENTPLIDRMTIMPLSPTYGKFDTKKFLRKLNIICSKFDKELSAETMISLLNNVRKIEYYQNPEWYPYSIDDIFRTFIQSNWELRDKDINNRVKSSLKMFGDRYTDIDKKRTEFMIYMRKNKELFEGINQVRLTNVLRNASRK